MASPTPTTPQIKLKPNQPILIASDILDDLASRFIINVPVEERQNLIRICFQIELAHWFYLDFYCSVNKQKCGIKQFAFQIFQHIPFLQPHLILVDKILEDWKQYKLSVPTYGAILLSEDLKHVLLVQSFWAKSSWGFPKGKINENEEPVHCAIREVYEETGYDIGKLIVPSEYIELVINYQYTRLYLVSGVPFCTVFEPKTRNEIKCCEWFPIDLLPVTKHENIVKDNLNMNGNSFFMILPFIKRLKKWLEKLQKNKHNNKNNNSPTAAMMGSTGKGKNFFDNNKQAANRRQRHKSMGDIEQNQQRSKSNGAQVYQNKNTPVQLIEEQLIVRSIRASSSNTDDLTEANCAGGDAQHSSSNKKAIKKQVEQPKNAIKRKLFENFMQKCTILKTNDQPTDRSSPWLTFKLDYSKFF